MIISLEEAKEWLRIEHNDEDNTILMLINSAETYLQNATGNTFDNTNNLAKLFCLVLITDWYENREMVGKASEKVRQMVESMVAQLSHCYAPQEGGTV
uniref:Uncharacterized phage protein (Putative DNA packaging) n=1 Tax=Geobacillus sp. (strain Y4.1MC1) TaxID=581103 RepID=A0A7U4DJY4_GEOS0